MVDLSLDDNKNYFKELRLWRQAKAVEQDKGKVVVKAKIAVPVTVILVTKSSPPPANPKEKATGERAGKASKRHLDQSSFGRSTKRANQGSCGSGSPS